ncbi:MAG: hypothetical protein GX976_02275 [Bacteroidales bacterium]|nr:hypothetical protein [Bacteroidales bacterium]
MKKWISLLAVLTLMVGVTACGSDKPDDLPASENASATKSFTLIASAGAASRSEIAFSLSDFAAISEYVKYVSNVIIQTTSYVEVSGITTSQTVELQNVTLSLKSDSKKKIVLPVIDSNEKFMELTQLTFLQEIMNEIYRRGSSTVVLTYTSTHNLTSPVTLAIKLDGRFTFN